MKVHMTINITAPPKLDMSRPVGLDGLAVEITQADKVVNEYTYILQRMKQGIVPEGVPESGKQGFREQVANALHGWIDHRRELKRLRGRLRQQQQNSDAATRSMPGEREEPTTLNALFSVICGLRHGQALHKRKNFRLHEVSFATQIDHLKEEAAELAEALDHFGETPESIDHVYEELADVLNVWACIAAHLKDELLTVGLGFNLRAVIATAHRKLRKRFEWPEEME